MYVRDHMQKATFVDPEDTVADAARAIVTGETSCVIVGTPREPQGIFSDWDVLRRVTTAGLNQRVTRIRDVMSSPVITIDKDASIEEAHERMQEHGVRRLPVTNGDGSIVGIILAKSIANGLSFSAMKKSYLVRSRIDYLASR